MQKWNKIYTVKKKVQEKCGTPELNNGEIGLTRKCKSGTFRNEVR